MNITGWVKDDASDTINLADARIPKYAAMALFLNVIAYTLRRNLTIRLRDKINEAHLNVMKISEEDKKNMVKTTSTRYMAIHLGGDNVSTGLSSPAHANIG